jgi:uncharacterized OB-fold protein
MSTRPIAPNLFLGGAEPVLLGGRHRGTQRIVFPHPEGDERDQYEQIQLPREGKLWSWTVQRFRPKTPPYIGPETFEAFAMGYVELPGAVIVETRLIDIPFDELRIGMPLVLTVVPFATDPDGTIVLIYAFRPKGEPAA